MAKKNIVLKVTMNNDKKTRKALKIVVGVSGVESAALIGSDKDQIKVTGEGIDSVELAKLLRKGVGCTELVSVGPVEAEKKPAATAAAANQSPATVVPLQVYPHHHYIYSSYGGPYYHVYESTSDDNPACTIM